MRALSFVLGIAGLVSIAGCGSDGGESRALPDVSQIQAQGLVCESPVGDPEAVYRVTIAPGQAGPVLDGQTDRPSGNTVNRWRQELSATGTWRLVADETAPGKRMRIELFRERIVLKTSPSADFLRMFDCVLPEP